MFDSILVPLDGSPLAECVLPHVIAISRAFNAKTMLLQVLDKAAPDVSTDRIDLLDWQVNKTKALHYLQSIDEQLHNSSLKTKMTVLEGLAAKSIIQFARDQQMDLIVLSSHGQSGLISGTTHKLIFSAPTSVLIIHASQPKEQLYKRILVPLDGSRRAENVLPIVASLARFHKSQVQIVHVVKAPEMARHSPPVQEDIDLSNRIVERNRDEALHYLENVQYHLPLIGVDVKAHLLVSTNVKQAIHELVEQEQIDLVVFSAHGYSGNNQWPYGSMVNNFILYGKVPLLVVQDLPIKLEHETSGMGLRIRKEQYVEN